MPVKTFHFSIRVSVVGLAMAILFPILGSIRDAHRREQAAPSLCSRAASR